MFSEVLLRLARRHLVSAIVDSVAFVVVLVAADLAQVVTTMMLLERSGPTSLAPLGEATRRRQEVRERGLDLRRGVGHLRRPRRQVVFSTPIIPY